MHVDRSIDCLTLKMVDAEKSLSTLNKDDLICLAFNYQQKYDITLNKIIKELTEICNSYNKSESDPAITKGLIELFRNMILTLERQWRSNA